MEILENDYALAALSFVGVFLFIVGFWFAFGDNLLARYDAMSTDYRNRFVLELQFPDDVNKVLGGYIAVTLLLAVLVGLVSVFVVPVVLLVAYFLPAMVYDYKKQSAQRK